MWDRMPGAVLTAPWTVSHNSIPVTPALPPPLPNSDPTRPALLHICHGLSHVHSCVGKKTPKKTKGEKKANNSKSLLLVPRIRYRGCLKDWCGPAVSIKAFNLSNWCCRGGRSDSSSSWHSSQSAQPWQPPGTGGESFQGSLFLWRDWERETPKPCDPF